MDVQGKTVPDRGSNALGVEVCLTHSRNSGMSTGPGSCWRKGGGSESDRGRMTFGPGGHRKDTGLCLDATGSSQRVLSKEVVLITTSFYFEFTVPAWPASGEGSPPGLRTGLPNSCFKKKISIMINWDGGGPLGRMLHLFGLAPLDVRRF